MVSVTVNSPTLSVDLVGFAAWADGRQVKLTWQTAGAASPPGFGVEQAVGAGRFEEVAFVEGDVGHDYDYTIQGAPYGLLRFRLRMLRLDGSFAYSEEVEVEVELPGVLDLEPIYPNPFTSSAHVLFAVREARPVRLELYTTLGRLVAVLWEGTPAAGLSQTVDIDGDGLTNGLYLVRLMGRAYSAARPVMLLR